MGDHQNEVIVPSGGGGVRVDVFLRDSLPQISRSHVKREIERGHVLLNGRRVRKGSIVADGDTIRLIGFAESGKMTIAEDRSADLLTLYEDASVLVVEKEAGLPTLPNDENDTFALACRIVAHYPDQRRVGPPLEAGLLHRLDTPTSGLMVVAKSAEAYSSLRDEWRWGRVRKEYVALVHGRIERPFSVSLPIGHHPRSARRMVVDKKGRRAETHFRTVAHMRTCSLLWINLREGRRHQVRVHLAESGHPVIGDDLYEKKKSPASQRLMLHNARVRFHSPAEKRMVVVVSKPPDDFLRIARKRVGDAPVETILSRLKRNEPEQ